MDDSFFKLTLVIPMDISSLSQIGVITLSETDTSEEESNTWDFEEDPCLGLEGSDLSDYLRDRAEFDALDAAFLSSANPPGQPSPSYTGSSAAF